MLFIDSLLAALSPFTLAMNFVGVMLGMIVGALPGLGSVVAITICLPFTFGMTSVSAIALLLGVYCGSICGGSIAAVLINTPGTPQSAATAFDGYPMARAGKPGKAIGWALAASIFGGVFSCVILTFAAPQIAVFALPAYRPTTSSKGWPWACSGCCSPVWACPRFPPNRVLRSIFSP